MKSKKDDFSKELFGIIKFSELLGDFMVQLAILKEFKR
jgi:hypothetical protein